MALKINSASGSITLTAEDGSGNANVTLPRAGFVSDLSDLSITATAAELNLLDGVTATTTELNYVDGVTSAIQTQIDGKLSTTGTAANSQLLDSLDSSQFLRSDASDTMTGDLTLSSSSGNRQLAVTSTSGIGSIEVGGSTGAFVDIKTPSTDDFDTRYGHESLNCTGDYVFQRASSTKLAINSTGIDVTGTASVDTLQFSDGSTQTSAGASTGKAIAMAIVFG